MAPPPKTFGTGSILFSGLSVHEWVCESVPRDNLVNTISRKPMKGLSPNFGDMRIWAHRDAE